MTRRAHSKIERLPPEIKRAVNDLLVGGATYDQIVAWLREKGEAISHSAVGRYGKGFDVKLQNLRLAREQAQAIVSQIGDRPATELQEAAQQLAVQKLLEHLLEVGSFEELKTKDVFQAVAALGRSTAGIEKVKQDYARKTAKAVDAAARRVNLTDEQKAAIREAVYGGR